MHCDLEAYRHGRQPHAAGLLKEAAPYIRDDDEPGLLRCLRPNWSIGTLAELLHGDDSVVSWVAAYCLGVIGGPVAVMPLVRALHHDDAAVVSAAEDALWRVWFDEAGKGVRRMLQTAADHIGETRYNAATATLDEVITRNPAFAEAYNQRAIARYLQEDYMGAIADGKRTVKLNRCHFGAHAGLGHAYTHLGHFAQAFSCYRAALSIHPRMEGIRQSMRRIQSLCTHSAPVA
ncbi:MAG: tetratricopeptide repeat protein [Phycisphaerae bacterium]